MSISLKSFPVPKKVWAMIKKKKRQKKILAKEHE
jgi:hypothetical protein